MSTPRFTSLPESVARTTLTSDDVQLAALSATPAHHDAHGTAVLLVHGFTGSKEDFVPILPMLSAAGVAAVAIDLPGQNESPPPTSSPSHPLDDVAQLASHIAAALRTLRGAGRPVHLVGHSFGGLAVRRAVLDEDCSPASLTLMSSGPAAVEPPEQRSSLEAFAAAMAAGQVDQIWSFMKDQRATLTPPPAPEVMQFLEQRLKRGDPRIHRAIAHGLLHEPDRTDELAAQAVPVHVVLGRQDDVWSPLTQQTMAQRLGTDAVLIDDAGHSPAVEAPHATADALLAAFAPVT